MSGHSKWATTKRKKAAIDAKRGKIFTKLGRLVTIAARDGKSGDPASNPSLRMAVENARAASMPKDNIERAIQRGIGGGSASMIEEVVYEAYAPGGVALLIECLTDNKNRTLGEIKAVLNKAGGSLATAGSVSFQFKKIGQILVDESENETKGEDLELILIDSGADDFEKEEGVYIVSCAFSETASVTRKLDESEVKIESTEIIYVATSYIDLDENKRATVIGLVDKLEELDDISNVYCNMNF